MSSGPVTPKLWQTTMRIRPRNKRTQPLAFIGVQTGVNSNAYSSRRTDLRRAWFPADEAAMKRVEEDYGLIVRFVVGHTPSREHEVALQKETEEFGPFLRLPINDTYEGLPWKTHAFVVTAFRLYNPKFVVKLDDDVYVRLDRLRLALAQYEERKFEFIGCMRREPIVSVPGKRYYEPDHAIFSSTEYHTYPLGSFYVLANSAAKMISSIDDINPAWLRHLASEDTMMGAWMLSLNVKHFDDRRLCTMQCLPVTVGTSPLDIIGKPTVSSCHQHCDISSTLPPNFSQLPLLPPRIIFSANETEGLTTVNPRELHRLRRSRPRSSTDDV